MAWKPVNGLTKFTIVLTNRAFLKAALFYCKRRSRPRYLFVRRAHQKNDSWGGQVGLTSLAP